MIDNNEIKNELIEGRNAVIEALRAGRAIDKIFIARGDVDKTLGHIASKAREKGIVVVESDRRKLDFMSQTKAHQGVIAVCAVRDYCSIEDILALAAERGEPPFVIVCDEISDPHNLGAIIRTAAATGFCDVYIAEGADAYSPKAIRSSMSGIFRVNVFTGKREELAEYIPVPAFVADMGGEDPFSVRREGNVCLIVGNEAHGVSEFMKNRADRTLGLDMQNGMESLNAAVAAGVLMYTLTKK